jgi:site-specific DNA-adenine methylase
MPPHDIYIEAFLGNGAIYRKKKPAFLSSIGIDLDIQVIERWYELKIPIPELINSDAISFLKSFRPLCSILKKLGVRVLIYLDPPYPKSSRRNPQNLYRHEMTDQEHQTLLIYILRLDANIIISSYPNHIYDKYLNTWNNFTFQAQTRGGPATEKVWYNYPEPTELHDYRYIGNDFREREQLKGIVTRNVAKFKRLPELQRNAIIHQLKTKKLI